MRRFDKKTAALFAWAFARSLHPRLAVTILLLAFSVSSSPAQTRVIDGDTLEQEGVIYRLHGIDAPEFGQECNAVEGLWPCGKQALAALADLVSTGPVRCEPISEDGYGRVIATCSIAGLDIAAKMVREGYAWAFVRYSDAYVADETQARLGGRGVWQATTQSPWDYRSEKWRSAEQIAPAGCPIKGNISENGRIYHTPWSPWYARTRINPKNGERWFCSEADALAAGWRAPRWH